MSPRVSATAGLTLVELLVVLVILGIGAMAVLPALPGPRSEDRAAALAGELARLLQTARTRALAEGTAVAVMLDPATGRYLIAADSGALLLPPGTSLATARPRLRFVFAADGSAHPDSVVVVSGERVSVVRVDRWSGAINVR